MSTENVEAERLIRDVVLQPHHDRAPDLNQIVQDGYFITRQTMSAEDVVTLTNVPVREFLKSFHETVAEAAIRVRAWVDQTTPMVNLNDVRLVLDALDRSAPSPAEPQSVHDHTVRAPQGTNTPT